MKSDGLPVPLTGIILAGGRSSRMGQNKALLPLGGRPLITHVLTTLTGLCQEIIIVTNDPTPYAVLPARLVGDIYPGRGALGGIHAGLSASRTELTLVVACDMPFLNPALLRYLVSLAPGYDAVVPRLGDQFEPLHAVYTRRCLPPMERLLAQGPQRVITFYEQIHLRVVEEEELRRLDPELRSFINVNTPEEWTHAQQLWESLQ